MVFFVKLIIMNRLKWFAGENSPSPSLPRRVLSSSALGMLTISSPSEQSLTESFVCFLSYFLLSVYFFIFFWFMVFDFLKTVLPPSRELSFPFVSSAFIFWYFHILCIPFGDLSVAVLLIISKFFWYRLIVCRYPSRLSSGSKTFFIRCEIFSLTILLSIFVQLIFLCASRLIEEQSLFFPLKMSFFISFFPCSLVDSLIFDVLSPPPASSFPFGDLLSSLLQSFLLRYSPSLQRLHAIPVGDILSPVLFPHFRDCAILCFSDADDRIRSEMLLLFERIMSLSASENFPELFITVIDSLRLSSSFYEILLDGKVSQSVVWNHILCLLIPYFDHFSKESEDIYVRIYSYWKSRILS